MQLLIETNSEYLMPEIVQYIVTEVQSMTQSNLCRKTGLSEGDLILPTIVVKYLEDVAAWACDKSIAI